jgi:hypothetical protein
VELQYPDTSGDDALYHDELLPADPGTNQCVQRLLERRAKRYGLFETRTVISSLRVTTDWQPDEEHTRMVRKRLSNPS